MANNLYRGTDGIEYVSHGAWSDPELIYDGKSFNYYDIDDALWDMFCDDIAEERGVPRNKVNEFNVNLSDFDRFVQDNAVNYLEGCIFGGYDYKIVK